MAHDGDQHHAATHDHIDPLLLQARVVRPVHAGLGGEGPEHVLDGIPGQHEMVDAVAVVLASPWSSGRRAYGAGEADHPEAATTQLGSQSSSARSWTSDRDRDGSSGAGWVVPEEALRDPHAADLERDGGESAGRRARLRPARSSRLRCRSRGRGPRRGRARPSPAYARRPSSSPASTSGPTPRHLCAGKNLPVGGVPAAEVAVTRARYHAEGSITSANPRGPRSSADRRFGEPPVGSTSWPRRVIRISRTTGRPPGSTTSRRVEFVPQSIRRHRSRRRRRLGDASASRWLRPSGPPGSAPPARYQARWA